MTTVHKHRIRREENLALVAKVVRETADSAKQSDNPLLEWIGALGKILYIIDERMESPVTSYVLCSVIKELVVKHNAPIEILQRLLESFPDVKADDESDCGQLLGALCYYHSDEYPCHEHMALLSKTILQDLDPWNYLCLNKVSLSILKVLLQEFASVRLPLEVVAGLLLVPKKDRNPEYEDKVGLIIKYLEDNDAAEDDDGNLLLYEALGCKNYVYGDDSEAILSALETIKKSFPDQFQKRNRHGDLAIHCVCNNFWHRSFDRGELASIVEFVLSAYPESSFLEGSQNRLPIHCAADSRCVSVDLLIEKAPESLKVPDPVKSLFPFQLAAADWSDGADDEENKFALNMIYTLLRKAPMVLARTLTPSFSSVLDDPDYRQICQGEMEFAQVERRQKRAHDELNVKLDQLRSNFRKKQGSIKV